MCGRFTLRAKLNRILAEFEAEARPEYQPSARYNIGIDANGFRLFAAGDDIGVDMARASGSARKADKMRAMRIAEVGRA